MKYAAVLDGQEHVFEHVAPCFASDSARITKVGDIWILHSSDFDACARADDVFPLADALLRRINSIFYLYACLPEAFRTYSILAFRADGSSFRGALRVTETINVYSHIGISTLSSLHGPCPLGSAISEKAITDQALEEALKLYGDQDLTWSKVYDIIEFLGGVNEIARKGLVDKSKARIVRQTANHFRHLGSTKNYPSPPKAPALREAREFVTDLLTSWISSRL